MFLRGFYHIYDSRSSNHTCITITSSPTLSDRPKLPPASKASQSFRIYCVDSICSKLSIKCHPDTCLWYRMNSRSLYLGYITITITITFVSQSHPVNALPSRQFQRRVLLNGFPSLPEYRMFQMVDVASHSRHSMFYSTAYLRSLPFFRFLSRRSTGPV
jgi:hypothetical protein